MVGSVLALVAWLGILLAKVLMKRVCIVTLLWLGCLTVGAWAQGEHYPLILRLSDRALIGLSKLITELRGARVVLVGELHEEPAHHRAQLSVLRSLRDSKVPVAIGMEMFRQDAQQELDRWSRGEMTEEEMAQLLREHWPGTSWVLYREILLFARDRRIPIVGLNLPREMTQKVAREGYGALPEDVRQGLGEISCDVDEVHRTFLGWAFQDHEGHTERSFEHFCQAQVLWDTAMAEGILKFLDGHPDRTIVVLTGVGHAWNRGIPRRISAKSDLLYRVVIPETQDRLRTDPLGPEDADYIWLRS